MIMAIKLYTSLQTRGLSVVPPGHYDARWKVLMRGYLQQYVLPIKEKGGQALSRFFPVPIDQASVF